MIRRIGGQVLRVNAVLIDGILHREPGVEADGVGANGSTSCALTGSAKIMQIARKIHLATEMQIRLRGIRPRLFVPPPNVKSSPAIFKVVPLSFLNQSAPRTSREMGAQFRRTQPNTPRLKPDTFTRAGRMTLSKLTGSRRGSKRCEPSEISHC